MMIWGNDMNELEVLIEKLSLCVQDAVEVFVPGAAVTGGYVSTYSNYIEFEFGNGYFIPAIHRPELRAALQTFAPDHEVIIRPQKVVFSPRARKDSAPDDVFFAGAKRMPQGPQKPHGPQSRRSSPPYNSRRAR